MILVFYTGDGTIDRKYLSNKYVVISREKIGKPASSFSIDDFELPLDDIRAKVELYQRKLLELVGIECQDVVNANFNNFYNHIVLEAYKWFHTYEHVKQTLEIDSIIITDGIDSSYCPYYEAEGEINSRLFYKTYDFIPRLLKVGLAHEGSITYKKKHSRLKLKFRIFVRRYVLLHVKLILSLKKKLFASKNTNRLNWDNIKFLFLSRGLAHSHYMLPYLQNHSDSLILVSDGYNSKNKNLNYIKNKDLNYCSEIDFISYRDILKAYRKSLKQILFFKGKYPKFVYKKMTININSALKEMFIADFDFKIYQFMLEEVGKKIKNKEKVTFISGEMLTMYPWAVAKTTKKHIWTSIQLQTTLMAHRPQVAFVPCDFFLFKSQDDFVQNKILNPIQKEKYRFWGSLVDNTMAKDVFDLTNILFYTQPVDKKTEVEIINLLIEYSEKQGKKLFLKPHPRDSDVYVERWRDKLMLIDKAQDMASYIQNIDLVVTRNSSIAQEVILKGIPTLFCLFTELHQKLKVAYIRENYKGVVKNNKELIYCMTHFDELKDDFYRMRMEMMQELRLDKDIHNFDRELRQL